MKKETAEKAQWLLCQLSKMEEIRRAIKEEPNNWWAFTSSNLSRIDNAGLLFPELFREKFALSVEETIDKLEKELDKL